MTQPTFSVILPNYNHAKFLTESLRAILDQSYPADEIIVVDDASTDDSLEVITCIARCDPRVKVIRNERNQGAVRSLQRALAVASGEYIYSASADDRVLPDFFDKCMKMLVAHPYASLCCTYPSSFDAKTYQIYPSPYDWSTTARYFSPEELANTLSKSNVRAAITSHAIWKKAQFMEAGGFREDLQSTSDWMPIQIMGMRYGICHVPEVGAVLRIDNASYASSVMADQSKRDNMFRTLLFALCSDENHDVYSRLVRANIIRQFSPDILGAVARQSQLWTPKILELVKQQFLHEGSALLKDSDSETRYGVAACFSLLGSPTTRSRAQLLEAVRSSRPEVQRLAVEAKTQFSQFNFLDYWIHLGCAISMSVSRRIVAVARSAVRLGRDLAGTVLRWAHRLWNVSTRTRGNDLFSGVHRIIDDKLHAERSQIRAELARLDRVLAGLSQESSDSLDHRTPSNIPTADLANSHADAVDHSEVHISTDGSVLAKIYPQERDDNARVRAFRWLFDYLRRAGVMGDILEYSSDGRGTVKILLQLIEEFGLESQLYTLDANVGLPQIFTRIDDRIGRNHIDGFQNEAHSGSIFNRRISLLHVESGSTAAVKTAIELLVKNARFQDGCAIVFDDLDHDCIQFNPGLQDALLESFSNQDRFVCTEFFSYGLGGRIFFVHDRDADCQRLQHRVAS